MKTGSKGPILVLVQGEKGRRPALAARNDVKPKQPESASRCVVPLFPEAEFPIEIIDEGFPGASSRLMSLQVPSHDSPNSFTSRQRVKIAQRIRNIIQEAIDQGDLFSGLNRAREVSFSGSWLYANGPKGWFVNFDQVIIRIEDIRIGGEPGDLHNPHLGYYCYNSSTNRLMKIDDLSILETLESLHCVLFLLDKGFEFSIDRNGAVKIGIYSNRLDGCRAVG